jgi:hypothetical protein
LAKYAVTLYKTVEATWIIEAENMDDAIGEAFVTTDEPISVYDEDNWTFSDAENVDDED